MKGTLLPLLTRNFCFDWLTQSAVSYESPILLYRLLIVQSSCCLEIKNPLGKFFTKFKNRITIYAWCFGLQGTVTAVVNNYGAQILVKEMLMYQVGSAIFLDRNRREMA